MWNPTHEDEVTNGKGVEEREKMLIFANIES